MYNAGRIIFGMLIFLAIATSPFWFNQATGQAEYMPNPVIATRDIPGRDACVMPTDYMRSSHMDLLNNWRQEVVRSGDRIFHSSDGKEYRKSLSNTCMSCHPNKAEFCDKCHNFMAVSEPDCWNCHVAPKEETL